MRNLLIFLLVMPVGIFLVSCGARTEPVKKITSDVIPVRTIPLTNYNAMSSITVSGQFTTDDEVMLSFKTTGIIDKIYVKEGDAIQKGQLLATLNLTEIDASLQQAQLSFEKSKRDYQRITNLYNDSVATLEQVQNAKTAMDLAVQQMNSARFNRRYSEIRAETNGFVLRKLASNGQLIKSGDPVLQTNGAGSANWILRAGVTDKQWMAISSGDQAEVGIGSTTVQSMKGKVSRKSESIDPATGLFSIDISITGSHPKSIAAGMFGSGTITTGKSSSAGIHPAHGWAIPYDALLDGDGSSGYVYISNDNKTAERVKVVIAGMEKDSVIISQGLENAGSLIISGSAYLTEHSPINIIP
jgi:RND family efflux transporter MFP subunit